MDGFEPNPGAATSISEEQKLILSMNFLYSLELCIQYFV